MFPGAEPSVLTSTLSRSMSKEHPQELIGEVEEDNHNTENGVTLKPTTEHKQLFHTSNENVGLLSSHVFNNFLQIPPLF